MTTATVRTGALFAYECRRVLRSPAIWAAVTLLLIAGVWGALNTARLHRRQAADLQRLAADETRWYRDIVTRAARYARPSSDPLPYWQDPTDAAGFSRYFLRRFAAKPHLPLSPLAAGQSDLQPFAVPLRLETLFGGDRVYDFEPPRGLATGTFDLGFVLLFVLPVALGAAAAVVGAQERDQDILSLVAAQPIDPRQWWTARLGALAAVLVPAVALCVLAALAAAGVPLIAAAPEVAAAVALVVAHALFWLAVTGACLARGHGAIATASTVAGLWLVLTAGVPLAGVLALRSTAPAPSPVTDVNELRQITDAVQAERDAVVTGRLVAKLGEEARSVAPAALDYSTRLVLMTEEMEARLAPQEQRRQVHAHAARRIARAVAWLSPQMALHTGLTDLAGTGGTRHDAFLRTVRAFQLDLRAFMYPRVLRQVLAPGDVRRCAGCPGRLNFADYEAIPRFTVQDAPPSARAAAALRAAGWLTLLAAIVVVTGVGRAPGWALRS